MKDFSRDLLLVSAGPVSPSELDWHLRMLDKVLYHAETWQSFCAANELIHIHRRKIVRKPHLIQAAVLENKERPFVFIHNKN